MRRKTEKDMSFETSAHLGSVRDYLSAEPSKEQDERVFGNIKPRYEVNGYSMKTF